MSFTRIWAMVLRYMYTNRDLNRLVEFFFWPMIDIALFGMIALWSESLAHSTQFVKIVITALVLWQIVFRSHFEICVNLATEFYDQNLPNLIASPLRKSEWILAFLINGLIKIVFTLFFGALVAWVFFDLNIFSIGPILLPFIFLCIISGWIIGFVGAAFVIRKGSKMEQLPWVVLMLFAIFSSVFYPLTVLPHSLQMIAKGLPMSYVFEGMRELLINNRVPPLYWVMSILLSIIYLSLAVSFFLFMFEKSRKQGFAKSL